MPRQSGPPLRELQQWMRWILTDPRGVPTPFRMSFRTGDIIQEARSASSRKRPRATSAFAGTAPRYLRRGIFLPNTRMPSRRIFRRWNALGEERFARLIAEYLREHPSTFLQYQRSGTIPSQFCAIPSLQRGMHLSYRTSHSSMAWSPNHFTPMTCHLLTHRSCVRLRRKNGVSFVSGWILPFGSSNRRGLLWQHGSHGTKILFQPKSSKSRPTCSFAARTGRSSSRIFGPVAF